MRKLIYIVAVLFAISAAILWIGCSDSDITVSSEAGTELNIDTYFPLKTGTVTQFMEIDNALSDTTYHQFSVGGKVTIGGKQVYCWISEIIDRPAAIDTGYLFFQDEALYYFENYTEIPEKLLAVPLEVGSMWLRYDATQEELDDNNYIDIFTNIENDKNSNDGILGDYIDNKDDEVDGSDGPIAEKCFPTTGSNYFVVSAIESLSFDNGSQFENCLKIENSAGEALNYYWYSPGIGLVKYAIGVDSENYPDGEIVGRIILSRSDI